MAKLPSTGLLLDIGAGTKSPNASRGWVLIDNRRIEGGVEMNAARPWPLGDGCARAVRTEHMIEHLTYERGVVCLSEAFRVLEPGGVCRVCTPDLEGIVRMYRERDPKVLEAHRLVYSAPYWSNFVNNYVNRLGHRFMYDFETLAGVLGSCGFEEIERTTFNESSHPVLAGTDIHVMLEPLEDTVVTVDAVKPRERD